jgi:hypothetical protein
MAGLCYAAIWNFFREKIKAMVYLEMTPCTLVGRCQHHSIQNLSCRLLHKNRESEKTDSILMGSDDGVYHSELLSFWTLSMVHYSKKLENTTFRKLNLFPSSGRGGGAPSQLGRLERANLNHWTT